MSHLGQDLRQALRISRRQPGFTITVATIIALGVGASTAMFSVLNAVLLSPLPQQNADRIVRLYQPNSASATTGLSPLEIADYNRLTQSLENVVEYHSMPFTFVGAGEAQRLQTGVVSAGFFEALGVRAAIGRTFRPGEDEPGADPVLLLSYSYWQREHGGSSDVLGTALLMNDRSHTVVGVLPPLPQYPDENDVYMPTSSCPFRSAPEWAENRQARGAALALVRDGVSSERLTAELRSVSAVLQSEYAEAYPAEERFEIRAVPLVDLIAQPVRIALLLLLAATALVLLIVCANVGNMMVVRLMRREGEMAVRAAFGATRANLVRQVAAESVFIAVVGGVLGLLMAYAFKGVLASFIGRFSQRAGEIGVDGTVVIFALGATLLVALAGGLLPLTGLRLGIATALRQASGRTSAAGAQARIRNGLIVVQVAVSLLLLLGAGVLVRTVVHLQRVDTGIDATGVLTARLDLNWTRYDEPAARRQFLEALERELLATPGVDAVGVGSTFPLNGDPAFGVQVTVEDRLLSGQQMPDVGATTASPGYFQALGVPLLLGRTFEIHDDVPGSEPVGVVTRSFADRYWPGADPLGKRVSFDGGASWGRVIGVVGDLRLGLENDFQDLIFVSHYRDAGISSRVLVRGAGTPATLELSLRGAVARLDAQQPLTDVRMLEAHRGDRLSPYRLSALLMGIFAVVALGVTSVGLAGVIAYSVARRTQEIGIRVAVGATPFAVLRLVLGQTLLLILIGAGLGVAAGVVIASLLRGSLAGFAIGAEASDPVTFAIAVLLLLVVGLVAGFIPARTAVRLDPLNALRGR